MSMNRFITARSRAAKSLAMLLAGFVLSLSLPMAAFAQAASAPATATAPAPTPAPAAAPAMPVITEEAVDNPYGLKALWTQGDSVAHTTLVILTIMSMPVGT